MVVYTLEQRWEIMLHYFENHGNVAECVPKLRTDFGRRKAPSAPYVRFLVKKVKATSSYNIVKAYIRDILYIYIYCYILLLWQKVCVKPFSTIEHFGDIIETNFA